MYAFWLLSGLSVLVTLVLPDALIDPYAKTRALLVLLVLIGLCAVLPEGHGVGAEAGRAVRNIVQYVLATVLALLTALAIIYVFRRSSEKKERSPKSS